MRYPILDGEIRSLSDALGIVRDLRRDPFITGGKWPLDKFPFGVWFRGQPVFGLAPEPCVFRRFRSGAVSGTGMWDETNVFDHLKLRVPSFQRTYQSAFDWLCLMQHYSVPTRLLDWSESILPALYFACKEDPTRHGELFVLNARRLNYRVKGRPTISPMNDAGVVIRSEMAVTRSLTKLKHRPDVVNAVEQDGRSSDPNWLDMYRAPVAVFPSRLNDRMVFQSSVFTLHGGKYYVKSLERLYKKNMIPAPVSLEDVDKSCLPAERVMQRYRIVSKKQILSDLFLLGIHEGSLFPEVDRQKIYLEKLWWYGSRQSTAPARARRYYSP